MSDFGVLRKIQASFWTVFHF